MESVCLRPECDKPLRSGKKYCSNSCAAKDRKRVRLLNKQRASLSTDVRSVVPVGMQELAFSALGPGAKVFLEEVALTLAEEKPVRLPPLESMLTESGYGNVDSYGVLRYSKTKSYRPNDLLSFETIDDMLRNGSVLFALEIKRSFVRSVLRSDRSIQTNCDDERMQAIVHGIMTRTLRRYADAMLENVPYGASFFEKEWSYQPGSFWNIKGTRGQVYGYRSIKAIHPKSIDHIAYKDNGHTFDGFVQNRELSLKANRQVPVPVDLALVLTYQKKFRNLWGIPATDPMYAIWFWLEVALRSFLRYLERTGTPVTVCEAPSQGKVTMPDDTKMTTMKAAQLLAGYAAKSNAIAMPSDVDQDTKQKLWGLYYLTDDKRGEMFVQAIELLGTLLMRAAVLGDRAATQDSRVGSFASAQVHLEVTQMHNEKILDELIEQINDYMVTPIVTYNGTSRTPRAWLETEGLDPIERDNLYKLIATVGNQADAFAMKRIDWPAVFSVNNIPYLSKEEAEELVEEEIERTKKRNDALAPPENVTPFNKPKVSPKTAAKIAASGDYLLYQIANGAVAPIVLSGEQATEIVDRFAPRPTVIDMHVEGSENGTESSDSGADDADSGDSDS